MFRRLSVILAGAGLALALAALASSTRAAPNACAPWAAHRTRPPILALDPRPGAPRIFAMQFKQDPRYVVSYATYRTKIDCMLKQFVLPHLARSRPNVVVFNEDVGLATIATGSRGEAARDAFARPGSPGCEQQGEPCGTLAALGMVTAAYAPQIAVYHSRFGAFGGLDQAFVGATDTIVRSFMGTFSTLARRYHLYMIGSADLPPFKQSRASQDIAVFADPDMHPAPKSVYVATAPQVYNEAFIWGPHDVRSSGPDVMRNVLADNRKVPLTSLEAEIGFTPGPATGRAAIANVRPYHLPGTGARIALATSLPAFTWGTLGKRTDPCSNTASYFMRCINRLGANLVIQDEANPGRWTGPDGNGIEQWQPLSWMGSTYRTVSDPTVRFDYNVTAMMVGNLADLAFDGQTAITQRGLGGAGCHYIGNARFVPSEDQRIFRRYAGRKPSFLAIAPWVVPDGPRAALRRVGAELAPGSHSPLEDDYVETAIVADLPFPPDSERADCVR